LTFSQTIHHELYFYIVVEVYRKILESC